MTTHIPPMLNEMVGMIKPRDGAIYLDGTFGGGGYSRALLDAANCRVLAIDRDPSAVADGQSLAACSGGRLEVIAGRFGDACRLLAARSIESVDGFTLDLGVSSVQLDDPARGFSFQTDGPLDMRMESTGRSAAEVINGMNETGLARLFKDLGDERRARQVAKAIVERRSHGPITRTSELADLIRGKVRRSADGLDPASRTFLALRIYVNDELGEIDRGLDAAERLLSAGGRLVVIAFHSLEDRRVKRFFESRCGRAPRPSRHQPAAEQTSPPSFKLLTPKAVVPQNAEVLVNSRARSARLRAAERTEVPVWPKAA